MSPIPTVSPVANGSESCDGMGIISQFVTWFLVVLGWWIVSRQNDKREHRKEVRTEVTDAITQIQSIEEIARTYLLTTAGRSQEARTLERQLKTRLQRLAFALRRLRDHDGIDAIAELIVFKEAVSGDDFETVQRQRCEADSDRPDGVSAAANTLTHFLEHEFRARYRSWLPWVPK